MKRITINLISRNSYALIGHEIEAFLMIIFMHYHGRITDAKMDGMFKGLRLNFTGSVIAFGYTTNYFPNYKPKNTIPFLRYVKTYHNTINDSWYNDEPMYTILQDTFYEAVITKKEMDMKTFMGYVNKFLCKGKKECYKFVRNEIIEPILQMLDRTYAFDIGVDLLKELGIIEKVNYPRYDNYEVWGYCCDDCDGDFQDYKKRQYHENVVKRLKDDVREILNKK